MPLMILLPLVGGVGFAGGFFASDGLDKIVKTGLVVGAGYLIYKHASK